MLKVGITGQSGFVGTHLFNTLGLFPEKYERIQFDDSFFYDREKLKNFVSSCDVLVHLAAVNRHIDPQYIFDTNILLVKQVIEACESIQSAPYILFSSSTQEKIDSVYGRSKRIGRELFEKFSASFGSRFTAMVIPNVFGPFSNPYFNSVVATFCSQLTHNEEPKIDINVELKLIYIDELIIRFIDKIDTTGQKIVNNTERFEVSSTTGITVKELLEKLKMFRDQYFEYGMIPDLGNAFDRNLFNTLLTYIDHKSFFPYPLKLNTDERGSFVETMKLKSGGQVSFSTTKPGVTRGNHFHIRKTERFAVIKGKAVINFRRIGTKEKFSFELDGKSPSFVDMPVWFTHNISNAGNDDVYTTFWISEHYDPSDPDTFFEQV